MSTHTHSEFPHPFRQFRTSLLPFPHYRARRKVLLESQSLQELQPQGNEVSKAAEASAEVARQGSIQSSSLPTQGIMAGMAEVCCVCCKCNCHRPAPPTTPLTPPTAPPTMHKADVQKDDTPCTSPSKKTPPQSCSEATYQLTAAGSEDRSCPMEEPTVDEVASVDTLQAAEGKGVKCVGSNSLEMASSKTHGREEVGGEDAQLEVEGSKPQQQVGRIEPKQETQPKEPKQEAGSNEPKQQEVRSSTPEQEAGINDLEQEVGFDELNQKVDSNELEQGGSVEKSDSVKCVGSSSLEMASSETVISDAEPETKSPTPTAPSPQLAPPPKKCPSVLSVACSPLPEASPSPVPAPSSSPAKEDDYSTVADALALAEGEHVVVCQRPAVSVTSPRAAQLPSQLRVLGSDDYCEVIFANTSNQTPLEEAVAQGGQGVKRVRTLPRQDRQEKEEVVKLKERSFSLRGKPSYPTGRRPVDILPAPAPPPISLQEEAHEERNHDGTAEDVAIATEGPQHVCSPTCRHGATFHIVEDGSEENPAVRSNQLPKSRVSSSTSSAEGEGPTVVEEVGQGRLQAATAYTMVSFQKKTRNRSAGENDELDEAPMHYFVAAPPSAPTTPAPAKSPPSPNKSLPSHIPVSRNQSCPVRSPASHVTGRRAPRGDYEEVDIPKRGGPHAVYEEVRPSRIPMPRRQNPSPSK